MQNFTLHCISEAVSPITHASGTAGNESIVAREVVVFDSHVLSIPFLSGNALRHRTVREPGALWLVHRLGLTAKLTLQQLNFLLHGGNLSESTSHENTRRIADMHRLFPLLRLVGGSLRNQIISGSLDVWRGTLVCEENRSSLSSVVGEEFSHLFLPAERFVGNYQYTTGDAVASGIADSSTIPNGDDSPRMIYSGQAVSRGAFFHHGYVLKHVSELELGALLMSLRLWQAAGGTIGGAARVGHGRLRTSLLNFHDGDEWVKAYIDHVDTHRDECVQWLNDAFASKPAKPAKASARGKKESRGSADPTTAIGLIDAPDVDSEPIMAG